EEILQQVGHAEGRGECVAGVGETEIFGKNTLPHQPDKTADQNARGDQQRVTPAAFFRGPIFSRRAGHYPSFSSTALVTSTVLLPPPRSGVRSLPSASTAGTARSPSLGASIMTECCSVIASLRVCA